MKITVEETPIRDLVVVKHEVFEDHRGFFMEAYRQDLFEEAGLPSNFMQLNHSRSAKSVVRGLHFQWSPQMGKMMRVTVGEAFLVAVDLRKGSPTQGKWFGTNISAENKQQLWAPAGFARGFCVLSDFAEIQYLTTGIYNPACESGIRYNDPQIGIDWPVNDPQLSDKDSNAQSLAEWLATPESDNFTYSE
jgi:dTDP-4-dehydrorhamnose 3,5-epimerase